MSLEDDEKLMDIKDNVKQSCKYLSEILYEDVYGYDSFSEEYRGKYFKTKKGVSQQPFTNPERQKKKQVMKEQDITGKQYRKLQKQRGKNE